MSSYIVIPLPTVKEQCLQPMTGAGVLSLDGTRSWIYRTRARRRPEGPRRRRGQLQRHRDYNERTAKFIDKGKVDKAAQEAKRAMDSDEAVELKKAEAQARPATSTASPNRSESRDAAHSVIRAQRGTFDRRKRKVPR